MNTQKMTSIALAGIVGLANLALQAATDLPAGTYGNSGTDLFPYKSGTTEFDTDYLVTGNVSVGWLLGSSMPGSINFDVNGNDLEIQDGGGNPRSYTGLYSGTGNLRVGSWGAAQFGNAAASSTFTGTLLPYAYSTTIISGEGCLFTQGPIILGSEGWRWSGLTFTQNGQVSGASDLTSKSADGNGDTLTLNGTTQTFGALTLQNGGWGQKLVIDLGEGSITFADSSANTWYESGQVLILNYTPGVSVIRFGTSDSALTPSQLSQIKIRIGVIDKQPEIRSDGELVIPGLDAPPAAFSLISPAHEAVLHDVPLLTWEVAEGAISYKVSLDDVIVATVGETNWPCALLAPSSAYTWKIVASNLAGDTDSTETRTFTTAEDYDIDYPLFGGNYYGYSGSNLELPAAANNSYKLFGNVNLGWGWGNSTGESTMNFNVNAQALTVENGGGNPRTYSGHYTGAGTIRFHGLPGLGNNSANFAPSVTNTFNGLFVIDGGNLYIGGAADVLFTSGPLELRNAGKITFSQQDQISSVSDVTTTASGATIKLSDYSQHMGTLTLCEGASVDTGSGTILYVTNLVVNGTPWTSEQGGFNDAAYVSGTGYIDVNGSGLPNVPEPGAFDLLTPADAETLSLAPLFTWEASEYAVTYKVMITNAVVATVTTPSWLCVTILEPSTAYTWKIIAVNTTGETESTSTRSFSTTADYDTNYPLLGGDYYDFNGNKTLLPVSPNNSYTLLGGLNLGWWWGDSKSFNINGQTLRHENGGGNGRTYSGLFTGTGTMEFFSLGWGTAANFAPTVTNTFHGLFNIHNGILYLGGAAVPFTSGNIQLGGTYGAGQLKFTQSGQVSPASDVTTTTSDSAMLLQGTTQSIGTLDLCAGSYVDMGTGGFLQVGALTVDSVSFNQGVYDNVTNPEFIHGTGVLQVGPAIPPGTILMLK